jgi:formylglycine-generating enzyme required for sulfatase activity
VQQPIPKAKAAELLGLLGIDAPPAISGDSVTRSDLLKLLKTAPRHARLGSTPEQIEAALALCKQYTTGCQREWFADETTRQSTLKPFQLDPTPVRVQDFRQFVETSNYRTGAEVSGVAYNAVDGRLTPVKGGNWRNAVGPSSPNDDAAVVGVNYGDAEAYCSNEGKRLPTEDEWEYAARGPEGHTYPWGNEVGPAMAQANSQPRAADGPAEGIGGSFRGLSGAVWEWVNTDVNGRKVLKGGSWRDTNPANKRAATRGYELPNQANGSTGFRCAQSATEWPDADYWMSQIRRS